MASLLFLAVVLEASSRRVVGWAMSSHLWTDLVRATLDMAVARRRPAAVTQYYDQGTQYTSLPSASGAVRPELGPPWVSTLGYLSPVAFEKREL